MWINDGRDADLRDAVLRDAVLRDALRDVLWDAELTGIIGIIDFVVFSFRAGTSCKEI
jgi:hypothetical protein